MADHLYDSTQEDTIPGDAAFDMMLGKAGGQYVLTGFGQKIVKITNQSDFGTLMNMGFTISQDTSQIPLGQVTALDFTGIDLSTDEGKQTALERIVTAHNSLLANYQLLLTYMLNFRQLKNYPTT